MFYEDDYDIHVAHFGTGDILVCPGYAEDGSYASVSLVDNCGKCMPINQPTMSEEEWGRFKSERGLTNDSKMNTVIRLQFTKIESIDCLIWALEESKKHLERLGI